MNDINPENHLRHVLTVIADHAVNPVDEMLLWNVSFNRRSSRFILAGLSIRPRPCAFLSRSKIYY
ncbi:transposase domain-containing protein [Candidimonas sp. SYP-B2681]|uniref:transposase domain-containing protein n=1 Tax=Candidimonas sp. SYP-B2681 TaxID=2497686 RepID=UPI001F310E10|nr:transposase domain-containing protein [Candidimonas sp. SYP-B2681]